MSNNKMRRFAGRLYARHTASYLLRQILKGKFTSREAQYILSPINSITYRVTEEGRLIPVAMNMLDYNAPPLSLAIQPFTDVSGFPVWVSLRSLEPVSEVPKSDEEHISNVCAILRRLQEKVKNESEEE